MGENAQDKSIEWTEMLYSGTYISLLEINSVFHLCWDFLHWNISRCAPKARKNFWFYSDKPRKIDVFGDNYFNRFYDKSGFFMTNGNFPKFYDVWQPWKSGPRCVAALETTQKIKMLIRSYTPRKIFGIFTHIFKDFTFRQTSKTYAPKC